MGSGSPRPRPQCAAQPASPENGDRKATITRERIDRLNDIGFTWDPKEQAWDERYGQLQKYKDTHGNCSVPPGWSENKELGLWVSTQRVQKTKFDRL